MKARVTRAPPKPPGFAVPLFAPATVAAAAVAAVAAAACAGAPEEARSPEPAEGRSPAEAAAPPLRVMSFNIRYGTAEDGPDAWPRRRELAFRTIRRFGPAVLGVQEALRFQLDELGRELPGYGEVGVGRDDGRTAGEYAAILYDTERLELLDRGTFWLSETPGVPGSTSWGNRITRVTTRARFRDRATGAAFHVFNAHWDHESQLSRERSAELVMERIRARAGAGEPVLLLGDFNAGEENPAFRTLLEEPVDPDGGGRLYDTFRALHPDAGGVGTFHEFTGERGGEKIDAVLASPGWRTLEAEIVRFQEDGRYPSDHFPVTAVLRLEASSPSGASPPPSGTSMGTRSR